MNSDEVSIEKSNLTTSWSKAEKAAETVRNYRGSTPDLLNGDDHFAYVVGYQDGCVHPNGPDHAGGDRYHFLQTFER